MAETRVYGIDLGTTYSCISYVDEHGKAVVIPNSFNNLTTPSVVYFESEDSIIVGETAKEVASLKKDQVAQTVKRVMGDPVWKFSYGEKEYTPQEISSFVLRQLVNDAENMTKDEIEDVVITCPAYFGVNQKEATKQAGELAGLNVLYVIPEPTAAAIAYGLEEEEPQTVMVYDLGGGTFDISVIEIKEGEIKVICTGGDHQLGGLNWDETLVTAMAEQFGDETGTDADELLEDPETYQDLLIDAENAKQQLSSRDAVLKKVTHGADRVAVEMTRERFDEITAPLLERTISMTEAVIETAHEKGYDRIDKLLLVGGSTYMPQVRKMVEERFPDFPVTQFDPNQAVAKGAALFGYRCYLNQQIKISIAEETGQSPDEVELGDLDDDVLEDHQKKVATEEGMKLPGLKKLTETKITNVTSKSFGIVTVDEAGTEWVTNLIVVDDEVPTTVTREFYTANPNQTGVTLQCMENTERKGPDDGSITLDPDWEIGSTDLTFERPLPQGSPVEVSFDLTADGLLMVHGSDLTTNQDIEATFKTEALMDPAELEEKKRLALAMTVSN